jgi:hypothetical protein
MVKIQGEEHNLTELTVVLDLVRNVATDFIGKLMKQSADIHARITGLSFGRNVDN